jgi:glucosamine-6-phosphate deaminase
MQVIIHPDSEAACSFTSRLIADHVQQKPTAVLGLATGRTMERVYDRLVHRYEAGELDLSQCTTFNLDEYIGLPAEDPHSYRSYMNACLFDRTNINKARTHLPDGMASDTVAEACRYEELISQAGGLDIQLLGIGRSGHIGFNEPLSALHSRTRDKALTQETIDQNAPLFNPPEKMPRRAMTMGIGTILDARRILLLATGEEKAAILAKAIEGPVTSMVSASALQFHPATVIIVDEAAASCLTQQDYYRWIFDNEPEWAPYR